MAYRDPDQDREKLADAEREAAAWLATRETAHARHARRSSRSVVVWFVICAGPAAGVGAASLLAAVSGIDSRSGSWLLGAFVGFATGLLAGIFVAARVVFPRKDGHSGFTTHR